MYIRVVIGSFVDRVSATEHHEDTLKIDEVAMASVVAKHSTAAAAARAKSRAQVLLSR
jgi:hypothetical protein